MSKSNDWRDGFFGRQAELDQLMRCFDDVKQGRGPQLAVVLGDRGMGKTRLVQQFYKQLAANHDPAGYWPGAAMFDGHNLLEAPHFDRADVREHYASFAIADRPMPYLWWGFRLTDSSEKNAGYGGLASYRETLDPHLIPTQFARQLLAERESLKQQGKNAGKTLGKSVFTEVAKSLSGVGIAATVIDLAIQYGPHAAGAGKSLLKGRQIEQELRNKSTTDNESRRQQDILRTTLDDLGALLAPVEPGAPSLPVVVFCDDAQFAGEQGNEGALHLLYDLWQRANLARWPLLLVVTHWAVEWHRDNPVAGGQGGPSTLDTFAGAFTRSASTGGSGHVIDLPKESELARMVAMALPKLPAADIQVLLAKADGNPQVLVELILLVQKSEGLRDPTTGALSDYGRQHIEANSTDLVRLIRDRLESETTSAKTRQAIVLSSVQGMEFLCALTDAAANALGFVDIHAGLAEAEHPHRMITGVQDSLASFVQRAYRDAARQMVGTTFGDPAKVGQVLLNTSRAIRDDPERWGTLSEREQAAALGVIVGLGEEHDNAQTRLEAAKALIMLIQRALNNSRGQDYARAAVLAKRFESGLDKGRWAVIEFELADLDSVREAIAQWHGIAACNGMALKLHERAKTLADELGTPDSLRELSVSLGKLGDAARARSDWEQAERHYGDALKIRQTLADELGTPDSLRDLSVSLGKLGDAARARSDWEQAERHYGDALKIRQTLADELRTPDSLRDLSVSLERMGNVARARSDWEQAERHYGDALKIRQTLADELGTPDSLRDLSVSLNSLGDVARARSDWEQAERHYGDALKIRQTLADELRTPDSLRDLSVSLERMGNVARARSDWEQAERHYGDALKIDQTLADELGTPDSLRDLSVSLNNLGDVARARSDWEQAERHYGDALKIRQTLADELRTPDSLRDLSVSLERMGNVARARSDWEQAERHYGDALKIRQTLADELGTPDSLRDLSVSLNSLGDVARARSDWEQAERHYGDALKIRRTLADELRTPDSLRDLAVSLFKLSEVYAATDRVAQACQLLGKAKPIFAELADSLKTPQSAQDLGEVNEMMDDLDCESSLS